MFDELDDPWPLRDGLTWPERAVQHMMDEILLFGDRQKPRSVMDSVFDDMLTGSFGRSHPLLGPVLRAQDHLTRSLWALVKIKPARRRQAIRRPPFRNLALANMLVSQSEKSAGLSEAGRAEEFAVLAEWIASLSWPDQLEQAQQIRASALVAQGDACRIRRDWETAEIRFGAAFALLDGLRIGDRHRCFYLKLSQLREDQGEFYEAARLQLDEMRFKCVLRRTGKVSLRSIVRLARLALKQNDPGRAMSLLTDACLRAEDDLSFGMHLQEITFYRAVCLAALGLTEEARTLIEETLPSRRCIEDRKKRLPYEWLNCRIAVHAGDLDHAIPRLEALRRWVFIERDLERACLSSIDLALAYAKKGGAAQRFPALSEDLTRLRGAEEKPWALGSLSWFREALEQGQEPAAAARHAAMLVHRRETSLTRPSRG